MCTTWELIHYERSQLTKLAPKLAHVPSLNFTLLSCGRLIKPAVCQFVVALSVLAYAVIAYRITCVCVYIIRWSGQRVVNLVIVR